METVRAANEPSEVMHRGGSPSCELWPGYYVKVLQDLREFGPGNVQDACRVFSRYRGSLKNCHHCKIRADNWQGRFATAPEKMPKFSTVLAEISS